MIKIEKVNKYFNYRKKNQIHVINNTSLELGDCGLVAMLGPSGCGKTTLLNAIGGLDKVKSGQIFINGQKITRKSTRKIDKIRNLNIGYIFQNYNLIDDKSVFDNVAITLKMIGIKDNGEIKKRVEYVLETLGLYRYRNRPCSMLSGGERQRVGIARAIVKNPNIIIADEPTGNLDAANTIEIMNIIKSISKNRLVLLVTHEKDIAKFYADSIIEIEDGKVIDVYENKHSNNLDYKIENKIYLKDFKNITNLKNKDNDITIYNDKQNDIKLTIVVRNNNIYIKGSKKDKIEVIDDNSNIEFINDHYKEIDKSIYEKYEFNFENIIKEHKPKHSSIFNPISLLINGFKKILDYSIIKKILLLGFLASGCFITYSISNLFGITNVDDKDFIEKNRYYYDVSIGSITNEKYNLLETLDSVNYILPGKGNIQFLLRTPFYYQTVDSVFFIDGSLVSNDLVSKDDIIAGRLPQNDYEIVVDKMVLETTIEREQTKQVGIFKIEDFLNLDLELKHMDKFKIVGIVDKHDPSIYANKALHINMLSSYSNEDYDYYEEDMEVNASVLLDYKLKDIKLKKGRLPQNDYEVIVNINEEYQYPLNKKLDDYENNQKLLVVGYYESSDMNYFFVNENTIKYSLLKKTKYLTVMPSDEESIIEDFNNNGLNIRSSYETSLKEHKEEQRMLVGVGLAVSGVILLISFIEIFLMIRASFLSRIKEIGILRAIGVKKLDIYKMFFGEIFAITTCMCVPGVLFMSYCLSSLSTIAYFAQNYMVNGFTVVLSIIVVYIFNLIVGLTPVFGVVRHTPAEILSRKDID